MNVKLTKRDFSGALLVDGITWSAERLDWTAVGGPAFARLRAQAELPRLWDLAKWLRCGVTVSDNQPAWWGYMSTVELHLGARVVRFSLDQMYNRIAVRYYDYTPATNQGELKVTGIFTDQASVNVYGYKERVVEAAQQMSTEQASAYARTLLKANSVPMPSPRIDPTELYDTQPYAVVECRGWWETLGWRFYQDTRGSAGNKVGGSRTPVGSFGEQTRLGEFFTPGEVGWSVSEIWVKLVKEGRPADNVVVQLMTTSGGYPGTVLASATRPGSGISEEAADWYRFTYDTPVALTANGWYYVVVSRAGSVSPVNYYSWMTDPLAGWDDGDAAYYNGSAWADFLLPVDFAFTVIGYDDNGAIMQRIVEVEQCGQFLAGRQFEPGTTGVRSRMYRDGGTKGRDELEEMLRTGTSDGARLLATIDEQRTVRFYLQPTAPLAGRQGLVIGARGEIARGDGSALPLSEQPAGQWARLGELATVTEMYGYGGAVFIESCTWDGKVLKVTK